MKVQRGHPTETGERSMVARDWRQGREDSRAASMFPVML